MARKTKEQAVQDVLDKLGKAESYHQDFIRGFYRRERSYRGLIDRSGDSTYNTGFDAGRWQSQLAPPWANHIVETGISQLVEDKIAYRIKPKARFYDDGEYELAKAGAKAHQILMDNQLAHDRFSETQRPFVLQEAIAGLSVLKTYWKREVASRKQLTVVREPLLDPDYGVPIGYLPVLRETERVEPTYEGPTTEVVNIEDFLWHEAATSPDRCPYYIHRLWMTQDEIKKLGQQGYFKNTDKVNDPGQADDETGGRDWENRNRRRDMVEVLEVWDNEAKKVTWIADRTVLLRENEYPFWHGSHPFVIASTQPQPFRLDAVSTMEKLMDLQEALWDVANQRHDNLRLLNNNVFLLQAGLVDDPSNYPFEPGARWLVEAPSEFQSWAPNPIGAEISLPAEAMLKADMQNLAGSQPFTSTSEARGVGADTATEAAIITQMAQSSTRMMKSQINYAYQRVGQQRLDLNRQFIRREVYVEEIGLDNEVEIVAIVPELLQGEYMFDITPMNESLMRQERRAEANALMQLFVQSAPVLAMAGTPVNLRAVVEDVLEAYDVQNPDRYFSAQPQALPAAGGGQPGQQGVNGGAPAGITGPGSIDPAVSPSSMSSMSPTVLGQRAMASAGSPNGGAMNLG